MHQQECSNEMNPEGFVDSFKDAWSWYHGAIFSLKILMSSEDFQGFSTLPGQRLQFLRLICNILAQIKTAIEQARQGLSALL